jgi:NADH dehydrogenase FAD-containing subunit
MASLPSTTEEERKRLLSFVVCGGGPTGVETAAVRPRPSLHVRVTRLHDY